MFAVNCVMKNENKEKEAGNGPLKKLIDWLQQLNAYYEEINKSNRSNKISLLESYWLGNCLYYDSRVVFYERKLLYKIGHKKIFQICLTVG